MAASLTHLIRRLGQRVVGVGTLGLLPGTTRDLGAAAGGCGVVTQGGFLHGKEYVLLRSEFAPRPEGAP